MLKSTIFREYDIRGVADTELLSPGITELGRAVGTMMQQRGGVSVTLGRDCRLSSPRLRDAFCAGLKASGCHVTDLGVVPTPLLYYSVMHLKATGGVMITGSHNPREYNGFKIMMGQSTIHGKGHSATEDDDGDWRVAERRWLRETIRHRDALCG